MHFQKPPLGTPLDWGNPLNRNMALHYAMNEGHGDRLHDLSLNRNHGVMTGFSFPSTSTSGWNPGHSGITMRCDTTDDLINCGHGPTLDITKEITLSVAFTPYETHPINADGAIINKSFATTSYKLIYGEWGPSNRKVIFGFNDGAWRTATSSIEIPLYEESLITGTYDGVALKIYVDGVQYGQTNYVGTLPSNPDRDVAINSGYTACDVDQVRIQPRAWTAKEVRDYAINPWQVYLDE